MHFTTVLNWTVSSIRAQCGYNVNSRIFTHYSPTSCTDCFNKYLSNSHQELLQLQPLYGFLDFLRDNLGKTVPKETFTHLHLSWSSVIHYLLPPSFTIHGILLDQYTCMTVFFHNLCPSFLWSTSWPGTLHFILHTFLYPTNVFFLQHMPIPIRVILGTIVKIKHLKFKWGTLSLYFYVWKNKPVKIACKLKQF